MLFTNQTLFIKHIDVLPLLHFYFVFFIWVQYRSGTQDPQLSYFVRIFRCFFIVWTDFLGLTRCSFYGLWWLSDQEALAWSTGRTQPTVMVPLDQTLFWCCQRDRQDQDSAAIVRPCPLSTGALYELSFTPTGDLPHTTIVIYQQSENLNDYGFTKVWSDLHAPFVQKNIKCVLLWPGLCSCVYQK